MTRAMDRRIADAVAQIEAAGLDQAEAMDAVRRLGAVPDGVGPDICAAPARGPVHTYTQRATVPDGEDGWRVVDVGRGRRGMARADAFDRMLDDARRHDRPVPFTPGQVAVGRAYAALVERYDAGGVRCSSLESVGGGGGSGRSMLDARLQARDQIGRLRARIGDDLAMRVVRPSRRGSRVSIPLRALVDAVCLEELTVIEVLRRFGWSVKGETKAAARAALCGALDRMAYPGPSRGRIVCVRSDGGAEWG